MIIHKCIIPPTITVSKQGYAYVKITNPTNNDIVVCLTSPLKVLKLQEHFEVHNFETVSQKAQEVESMIRTEHLNEKEKVQLLGLCTKYADIFYAENQPLTFTSQIKHSIKTTDEEPIYVRSYQYPHIHKDEIQIQINKMLEQKIIQPSNSPWSSPIWIVPKKPDALGKVKWRLVVDYRKLNEKTMSDRYPMPNISDILDKLGRSQYFSTVDLYSGFHQIEMNKTGCT